jgi:hypothetical protein
MSASSLVVDDLLVFDVEYVDETGSKRAGLLGGLWSVRFEDVAPVRGFVSKRGTPGFAGFRWCATTGGHVGYESWLERDNLALLDYDSLITGFSSQPFWLCWHDGRRRRHAPDYFARRGDGAGIVVDVRSDEQIDQASAEAFAATARACAQVGWEFRRVGTVGAVLAANLRWLGGYRHPRCARAGLAERLCGVFAEPRGLFEGAEVVGDRLETLPGVFHLLWRQVLVADVRSALLGPDTLVSVGAVAL